MLSIFYIIHLSQDQRLIDNLLSGDSDVSQIADGDLARLEFLKIFGSYQGDDA